MYSLHLNHLYQSKSSLSRLLPLGFTLERLVPPHLCCRFAFLCTVCELKHIALLTSPHPRTRMDILQKCEAKTVKAEFADVPCDRAHTTKEART